MSTRNGDICGQSRGLERGDAKWMDAAGWKERVVTNLLLNFLCSLLRWSGLVARLGKHDESHDG